MLTPCASAAERLYWTNYGSNTIAYANADGSGDGGELNTTGAAVVQPGGIAVDPATDRIFWANFGENSISYASLDGTGGGQLNTGAAMVDEPFGLTVDTATDRVYWINSATNTIAYANADGSGDGAELNTTGASITDPDGLAVDTSGGRVYWANGDPSSVGYANLDGSGGGTLDTSGAASNEPWGIVVNQGDGRVYWTNTDGSTITYARTDIAGLGGMLLHTFVNPFGMAIDPIAGQVFWIDGHGINTAGLDGSGASTVSTTGATEGVPMFLVVVAAPVAGGPPVISGGSTVGTNLSCSHGVWAPDDPGDFYYRSPFTYAYRWTLDGATIPGQTSATLTPVTAGSYACVVTGTNAAGSATQTSAALAVSSLPNPGRPIVPVVPPAARTTSQAPSLTRVAQTHRVWRERLTQATSTARRRVPVGTAFSFTVDQPGRVALVFWHTVGGRLMDGDRCRAQTRANHRHRRCWRVLRKGALNLAVAAGAHRIRFDGRIRGHTLPLGSYAVSFTASSAATGQHSAVRTLRFRIAG
jgi:DNA-binding beta-propeller fold protein YncE